MNEYLRVKDGSECDWDRANGLFSEKVFLGSHCQKGLSAYKTFLIKLAMAYMICATPSP